MAGNSPYADNLYQQSGIVYLKIQDVKWAFKEFIENEEFNDFPDGVKSENILDWLYQKRPIKENGLLKFILTDTLSEAEEHSLKLLSDNDYKRNFETETMLNALSKWRFVKIPNQDTILSQSDLYYKEVDDGKYLIFNHYNLGKNYPSSFILSKAIYKNKKQIGKIEPYQMEEIRAGFNLERDYHLIRGYVE